MASGTYEVHEVNVAARPVAGVQARVARGRVSHEFKHYLDQVYEAARTGAVRLDGQNIFVYRAAAGHELAVDFCVGVTAPFAAVGAVEPLHTPHGVAAMTTHVGVRALERRSGPAAHRRLLSTAIRWRLNHEPTSDHRPLVGSSAAFGSSTAVDYVDCRRMRR